MPALLCPTPQIYRLGGDPFAAPLHITIRQPGPPLIEPEVQAALAEALHAFVRQGREGDMAAAESSEPFTITLSQADIGLQAGYRLIIEPTGGVIEASDTEGACHALATLCQLLMKAEVRPCHIEDAPVLPVRGYMLDISRDRVPALATLAHLVDILWLLKFNQLQLYMEHTFAFPDHERVWGASSALEGDIVEWLQARCAERSIELVPNFNSLGHFERWLRHPEYQHLAETPGGTVLPSGVLLPHCTTLAPGPQATDFLRGLYADFLPLFESTQFNAGLDEPWELGLGRSRERCEREGKHAVYLEHLREVAALARTHGKRLQFWADIVLEDPYHVEQLPHDATGLVWGYEVDHPFEDQAMHFSESGIPFILCPGTSTWNSIGGRWPTAAANIHSAVSAAVRAGGMGVMLTDWGDNGHHQPPSTSLPALALAAQLAWAAREGPPVAEVVETLLFGAPGSGLGQAIMDLGSVWEPIPARLHNASWLFRFLFADAAQRVKLLDGVMPEHLVATRLRIQEVMAVLEHCGTPGSNHIASFELCNAAELLDIAALFALEALDKPAEPRSRTLATLTRVIGDYELIWTFRNWPGGLHESSARLRKLLEG